MHKLGGWTYVSLTTMLIGACGFEGDESGARLPTEPDNSLPSSDRQVSAELPFNLDAVVHDVGLRFRPDLAGAFSHQPTYSVAATGRGVSITPRAWHETQGSEQTGAALTLETVEIARDMALPLGAGATDIGSDGMLQIDRGVAQERFVNRDEGTEQQWHFRQQPAGSGDLTVRVSAQGQAYLGQTAEGHHFIDESTGVGVLYGAATWMDATGAAYGVSVAFDASAGALVLVVPAAIVDASIYPAVLDPVVSAEINGSSSGVGPSAYAEETPDVAYDGTNYMAVWSDFRDGVSADIYGTLVSASQVVLTTTGFRINGADQTQRYPRVAFNGTEYLVVWQDERRTSGSTAVYDVYAQRLTTAGVASGTEMVISASGNARRPAITRNGSDWLVAWEEWSGSTSVVNYRPVTAAGALGTTVALSAASVVQTAPSVRCTAANCLVVFSNGSSGLEDVHGQRITGTALVDAASFTISGPGAGRSLAPDVATDGTDYMVVWQDYRTGDYNILYNRVLGTTGAVQNGTGAVLSNAADQQEAPTIAFDGTRYVAVWFDIRNRAVYERDVYAGRTSTAGVVLDPNGFSVAPQYLNQDFPRITAGPAGTLFVVWQDLRGGPPLNIRGTQVQGNGTVADRNGTVLASSASRQIAASIAYNGAGRYLLVYQDSRTSGGSNYDIMCVRVDQYGSVLDPTGKIVSVHAANQSAPDVSFGGGTFLVVWQDRRNGTDWDVYGVRLTADTAARVDASDIPISTATGDQITPTLAYNAGTGTFAVAWADRRSGTSYDIYMARVATTGVVIDPTGVLQNNVTGDQIRPDVASNGAGWMVVWTDQRNGAANQDIRGLLLNNTFVRTSNNLTVSGLSANNQYAPRVAWDGSANYIAVWVDERLGASNPDIRGNRIAPAGSILNGSGVILAGNAALKEGRPAIANLGASIFVVWTQSTAPGAFSEDLWGREFSYAFSPVAPAFLISGATGNETQPAIGVVSPFRTLVGYQRFIDTAGVSAERVKMRTVGFP